MKEQDLGQTLSGKDLGILVGGYLTSLRSVRSSERPRIYDQVVSFLIQDPRQLMEAFTILTGLPEETPQSHYATTLLEKIETRLKTRAPLPSIEGVLMIAENLTGPNQAAAERVLLTYAAQPVTIFSQGKNRESLKSACQRALDFSFALANALMTLEDGSPARKETLKIWNQKIARPDLPTYTLFDFLIFTEMYGQSDQAKLAHVILHAIGTLETMDIGRYEESYTQLGEAVTRKLASLKKAAKGDFSQTTFFPELMVKLESLDSQMKLFLDSTATHNYFVFHPEELDLGNQTVKRRMAYLGQLLSPKGIQWEIIPFPEGTAMFVFWRPNQFSLREKSRLINQELKEFMAVTPKESVIHPVLTAKEVNTLLTYLKPETDPQKLANQLEILSQEAQGGTYAISRRGDRVILKSPSEARLRQMGLEDILFKQEREGIKIEITWSPWNFSFNLDRRYQPQGLEPLTPSNHNWFIALTFSYLAAIKNPVFSGVKFLERKSPGAEWTELEGEKAREYLGRCPHFRVLPLGQKSQLLADNEANEGMRFHFGVDLSTANKVFGEIQTDKNLLEKLRPPLKNLIEEALRRVMDREEKPVWRDTTLYLTNPPVGSSPESPIYTITFVKEAEIAKAEPLVFSCPQAAERILDFSSAA